MLDEKGREITLLEREIPVKKEMETCFIRQGDNFHFNLFDYKEREMTLI